MSDSNNKPKVRFLTYADLGLKAPKKAEDQAEESTGVGLRLRLRQHDPDLRSSNPAAGDVTSPDPTKSAGLESLMMPGWAKPNKAIAPPREVPRGRIFGDELNEAFLPTVGKSNFDESKHPRADDGRFSESAGGGGGSATGAAADVDEEDEEERSEMDDLLEEVEEEVDYSISVALDDIDDAESAADDLDRPSQNNPRWRHVWGLFESGKGKIMRAAEELEGMIDRAAKMVDEGKKARLKEIRDKVTDVMEESSKINNPDEAREWIKALGNLSGDLKTVLGKK